MLTLSASACRCKLDAAEARALDPTGTPASFSEVPVVTPREATLSFAVPDDWVEPNDLHGNLTARTDPDPTSGFHINVSVTVQPRGSRDLAEYTRAHKCALEQEKGEVTLAREVHLDDTTAYELVTRWPSTDAVPPYVTVELIEVFGEEAIIIRCAMAEAELENTWPLCDRIFATASISGPQG